MDDYMPFIKMQKHGMQEARKHLKSPALRCFLYELAIISNWKGQIWRNVTQIAEWYGISRETASRHLSKLCKIGFCHWVKTEEGTEFLRVSPLVFNMIGRPSHLTLVEELKQEAKCQ
jgi:DNA-binding MarR family transcriptional regulator